MKTAFAVLAVLSVLLIAWTFPRPTPPVTKEPTPQETQEITPEPTEEITPEPTEEITPEPTEEITPEPTEEITPEVTQENTPEVTPEVVTTPEPNATRVDREVPRLPAGGLRTENDPKPEPEPRDKWVIAFLAVAFMGILAVLAVLSLFWYPREK